MAASWTEYAPGIDLFPARPAATIKRTHHPSSGSGSPCEIIPLVNCCPPAEARLLRALFEGLFGLHREADGDVGLAVEHFQQMAAQQAMKLALGAPLRNQFDAAVAGMAFGTGQIRFFHGRYMLPDGPISNPAALL